MDPVAACVFRTLLVLVVLPPVAPVSCPRPCSCPQATELHCTFRSLITIPAAFPKLVERMNLGFNSINKITEQSMAGLRRLELLMVHGNDIHTLPDGVFRDLESLQMLKMSYNKLKEINRHTLQGLWSLARLHLDHNQLELIHPDAFQGLTSLRLLQLEGNRLQQLHPSTFTTFTLMHWFHVSTLRHLHLSDNRLTSLSSRLVATMPQLENLYLHGNPWTCDCNMRWLHDWDKTSAGVMKCKKDRALPGGQLCPMCSSPSHLQKKELQALENLVCSSPVISSPHRTSPPEDTESEVMTTDSFREPLGNISLGLSDEHGNVVDLDCGIGEPREISKINWEQVSQLQLASNISLSVDLECPVDREKYEQLWRLIAYYSNVPAHLQRGAMLGEEPHPTYVYRQDSERDALYYTGVKVNVMARPAWLMQASADLQLNRLQSSAKVVKLTFSTVLMETVDVERSRRQRRTWVSIESKNETRKVLTAVLGSPSQMSCDVHSSGQAEIHWMLPDGSKVEAPYTAPDDRVSVSSDGTLVFKSVRHSDTGIYYCIAKVHGDLDVLPFYLTVQESSSPHPGKDASVAPTEVFAGNPISLPCTTSGSPDAEINWILPSNSIISFRAKSAQAVVHSNGTLHIPQARLLDSGFYKCIAINQHGVDTLAVKVSVVRRKGVTGTLRKFLSRPQSASGVNTQVQVFTRDPEEASGDTEVAPDTSPINRQDALRRRIPGSVPPGRRGLHPLRNTRRRQPVLRKPTGPHVEDTKAADSKRRINVSKSKIDPEKWADILAKIRDRNSQSTVTSLPAQHTTEGRLTEQTTQPQENIEGSSDGVTVQERESQDYLPTPHTQLNTNKHTRQGQSNPYTAPDKHEMTSSSARTHIIGTTAEPLTMQTAHNVQHTTRNTFLDPYMNSNSVFPLPQTTSVPLRSVTLWQASTNSASGRTFSPRENHSTDADVDAFKAAASEKSENAGGPGGVAGERPASRSQTTPTVGPTEPGTSQDKKNGKHLGETATSPPLDDVQRISQTALTTASSTTLVATPVTMEPVAPMPPRLRQPGFRKKKGSRRKNRRKQKLNEPTQYMATTPSDAPLATVRTTASPELKIEPLAPAKSNTTVPFRGSQAASSGRLSHKENPGSRRVEVPATEPSSLTTSPPRPSPQPLAKPLFQSTSAAPSFPSASPEVHHGKTSSQTASETAPLGLDMLTSTSALQMFTDSPSPPVLDAQSAGVTDDLGPVPFSDMSSLGFHTATVQTHFGENQPNQTYSPTGETLLVKEAGMHFSPLPSPSASSASLIEHETTTTSVSTSSGLVTTHSLLFEGDLEAERVTTKGPEQPERYRHTSIQNNTPSSVSEGDWHHQENANASTEDALVTSSAVTTTPPVTLSKHDPAIPSTEVSPITQHYASSTQVEVWISQRTGVTVNRSKDRHIDQIFPTSNPGRISDNRPATQSPDHNLTSPALKPTLGPTENQRGTSAPRITTIQAKPLKDLMPTSPQDGPRPQPLPGPGSMPRGKPRINKSNFQMFTVKAETDAQLPCEAEGEPKPFLSWTIVASGASIPQNTRVQRFEVHPNGTLIIRNAQAVDGGLYQCTVQNQYGTDKMAVDLVVLSQPPRVLQPRDREITVHLGGKVDLECKVEGHPIPRVTWVLPNHFHLSATPVGVSLQHQQRLAVLSNGTLRISQAGYADRGIYKCIGSSAVGADSVSVHLHVSALPPVIQQAPSENRTVLEGSNAYIHCSATGAPPPAIRWMTPDGIQLAASQFFTGHNFRVFPNGTLHIMGLGPKNAGRYECSATNAVASSKRTVILTTRRNPSSSKASITLSSLQRTDVIYGRRLLLNCVATGEPNPWIIWRTPSKKLVDAQYSFDPRIKVFPNGTITIHPVTDKDGGDYMCVARNKMGDDHVLLRVNVLTRPAKIEQKQHRSSQEVVYGGDLKVDCVASGLPNPEISWALPDGTMINPVKWRDRVGGGRSRRYLVFDNGTLYFNEVGMPEEGDYTCYAENQLGKDEMKVRVKVKVGAFLPQILDKEQKSVKVFYGETSTLRCNAKGEPKPVITWISPTNRAISPALDKYQVLDDGTLVVQKVQRFDGGNYTCMARNSAGQDHKVVRLEVLVTPPVINGLRETTSAVKITAVQDQRKLVDCVAKGTPTPRIMWVLPGNVILPAPYYSNRMAVHQNGTLEIRSPKRTDSGLLVCIARNEGGEVRLVFSLDVKELVERPRIRGPKTESLSLTVGSAMALNCSFDGLALPHVTWILPNGTPLSKGDRFSKFFHQPDGSLTISNPSVGEAGMYRCLGRNSGGLVERTITLLPGRKPEIINRYNAPISVMNGEAQWLHCLTSGEPLRLTWTLPSGVVLNRPQRAGRYSVLPNGTLAIQQVSVYDRGSYMCRAANEYGSSLLPVSVVVIALPPRITSGPQSVTYAKRGVAIQLNCVATGIPKVELAWETPDKTRLAVSAQPRLFGNKYLHPQGSLVIQNPTLRDAGMYRCTARNAIGVDSKSTFLNVF